MLKDIQEVLSFLDFREKKQLLILATLRTSVAALDLMAIILLGLLIRIITSNESLQIPILGKLQIFRDFDENYNQIILMITSATLILFVLKSVAAMIVSDKLSNKVARIENRVATSLFTKILSKNPQSIEKFTLSELQNSLTLSLTSSFTYSIFFLITFISEGVLLFSILILFTFIDIKLTILLVIYFSIVGYFLQKWMGKKFQENGELLTKSTIYSQSKIADALSVKEEINLRAANPNFIKNFMDERSKISDSNSKILFLSSLPRHIIETSLIIGIAGLSTYLSLAGDLQSSAEKVGIFIAGSLRMMASSLPLQASASSLKQHLEQSKVFTSISKYISERPDLDSNKTHFQKPDNLFRSKNEQFKISLKNVTVRYSNSMNDALQNLNFTFTSPGHYALIGPSGAGKSTLVQLLIRRINPSKGSVEIADLFGNKYPNDILDIGYVPQTAKLIQGSLLFNITLELNSQNIDFASLEKALKHAQLHSMVDTLPNGINQLISPQNSGFSGGQVQRIALARALYVNPDLIILDEATSALDAQTEHEITSIIDEISKTKLVISIAHRLSTVENASEVLLLNQGELVDSGKLSDLAHKHQLVANYIRLLNINDKYET